MSAADLPAYEKKMGEIGQPRVVPVVKPTAAPTAVGLGKNPISDDEPFGLWASGAGSDTDAVRADTLFGGGVANAVVGARLAHIFGDDAVGAEAALLHRASAVVGAGGAGRVAEAIYTGTLLPARTHAHAVRRTACARRQVVRAIRKVGAVGANAALEIGIADIVVRATRRAA